jgi:hypothetical protein
VQTAVQKNAFCKVEQEGNGDEFTESGGGGGVRNSLGIIGLHIYHYANPLCTESENE